MKCRYKYTETTKNVLNKGQVDQYWNKWSYHVERMTGFELCKQALF